MTASADMLATARRGALSEPDRAAAVARFAWSRLNPDGGFRGRTARSDLYYTVFGIDCLLAAGTGLPRPAIAGYVAGFGNGKGLDFVHLTCLARCRARLENRPVAGRGPDLLAHNLNAFRCPDGGFNTVLNAGNCSVTGNFLAFTAFEHLGLDATDPAAWVTPLLALRSADGGYANQPGLECGTTLATAGVAILGKWLHAGPDAGIADWLLRRHQPQGGFASSPDAPIPDLLSTATALYALHTIGRLPDRVRAPCRAFVAGLRHDTGGYAGHWFDDVPDCEYTFYALLALGCLTPAAPEIGLGP